VRIRERHCDLRIRAFHFQRIGPTQCALIGSPGHTGHVSLAALSQTVNTKSIFGAPGPANSSHDLERISQVL